MSSTIVSAIYSIVCFVPAIVFHEVAHGFMAHRLGDPTAKSQGRLSLNPLRHIDPFGTVLLPLLLMVMGAPVFGYAKPVPYNPRYFKHLKRDEILTGLAGPFANLLLGCLGALLCWGGYLFYEGASGAALLNVALVVYTFGAYFTLINFYLMFFNLIPIPPLDGSSVIVAFLPHKWLPQWYRIQHYSLPILMLVLIVVPMLFNVSPIDWYMDVTAGNLADLLLP
jgi:Zn-dependent protease